MGRLVIACYRPKSGREDLLYDLLRTHVDVLRDQGLVTDREAVRMEARDGTVIEVFEWASPQSIEDAHANAEVQRLWARFETVCDHVPLAEVPEAGRVFAEFAPLRFERPRRRGGECRRG